MRISLRFPLLVAAVLAVGGCVATPPAPSTLPMPPITVQNCTPPSPSPGSFPSADSSGGRTSSAGSPAGLTGPGTLTGSMTLSGPAGLGVPAAPAVAVAQTAASAPTAAQRRALIDKRLADLRHASDTRQPPATALQPPATALQTSVTAVPAARKAGIVAVANSGNGATARDMPVRSGDEVVARRLRKAAEQETNPALKQKLWQEYADYSKNTQGR